MSQRFRALAPLMAGLLLLAQHPNPAAGDHGGRPIGSLLSCERPGVSPSRCTSVADNLRHHVYFDQTLTDGLASALRATMAEDYDPTDLVLIEQAEVTPPTDVIAYSEDYGDNGAAGWVYCPTDAPQGTNARGDRWCRMQEMHFNLNPRFAAFFDDAVSRDHITCHELGHTVGLRHWGNPPVTEGPTAETCMTGNTPNGPTGLDQIDRDHINAYPYAALLPARRGFVIVRAPGDQAGAVASAWSSAVAEAAELEHFGSLPEMTRSADAVVRGTVMAVAAGRAFGGASGNAFHYAAATLRVDEVIAGELPERHAAELTLELPLFDGPDSIAAMQTALPEVEGIFFLRNKGASAWAAGMSPAEQLSEAEFYRLVVLSGVVLNDAGQAALPPGDSEFLAALSGLPFDDVIRRARSANS